VADGGDDLHILRLFASILNKQSQKADKGLYASLQIKGGIKLDRMTAFYEL
jgi:hypothetical protein